MTPPAAHTPPTLAVGQFFDLVDARNQLLGKATVARVEEDLIFGSFQPGPAYRAVEPLFTEFVRCANEMLLTHTGILYDQIAALGIHLAPTNGERLPEIYDVQLFEDSCTFRVKD